MLKNFCLILLLSVSISLAVRPKLRNDIIWRPVQLIPVIKDWIAPLMPSPESWNIPVDYAESDALNQYAQALAEQTGNPISFIDSYSQSSEHILSFGFQLKGDVTLETIMTADPTVIAQHTSGFLDFRYRGARLSITASEIRDSIINGRCFTPGNYDQEKCRKFRQTGSVSVSSETFNFNTKLNSIRDLLSVMTMYNAYLESQIKLMDANGNIPLGNKPFTFRIQAKGFDLTAQTTRNQAAPLKVDPKIDHNELLELIDVHFQRMTDEYIIESILLPQAMDRYGFGISVDSSNVITVVYAFGGQKRPERDPSKTLMDYYSYAYVTPKGTKYNYNPRDLRMSSFEMQRRSNKFMIGAVNYERLNTNLRPVQNIDPKLYELSQHEADRSASAGKFVEPEWKGFKDNKAMLIGVSFVGKTTVRDFIFADEKSIGSIVCYDNFSNTRAKVYSYGETYGQVCNKAVVDYWTNFDSAGSGFGYNSNGDFFQYTAMSQLLDD